MKKLGYGVGNTNGSRSFAGKTEAAATQTSKSKQFASKNVGRMMK